VTYPTANGLGLQGVLARRRRHRQDVGYVCLDDDELDEGVIRGRFSDAQIKHLFECDLCFERYEEALVFLLVFRSIFHAPYMLQ
jgi:hypothetical protein